MNVDSKFIFEKYQQVLQEQTATPFGTYQPYKSPASKPPITAVQQNVPSTVMKPGLVASSSRKHPSQYNEIIPWWIKLEPTGILSVPDAIGSIANWWKWHKDPQSIAGIDAFWNLLGILFLLKYAKYFKIASATKAGVGAAGATRAARITSQLSRLPITLKDSAELSKIVAKTKIIAGVGDDLSDIHRQIEAMHKIAKPGKSSSQQLTTLYKKRDALDTKLKDLLDDADKDVRTAVVTLKNQKGDVMNILNSANLTPDIRTNIMTSFNNIKAFEKLPADTKFRWMNVINPYLPSSGMPIKIGKYDTGLKLNLQQRYAKPAGEIVTRAGVLPAAAATQQFVQQSPAIQNITQTGSTGSIYTQGRDTRKSAEKYRKIEY